MSTNRLTGSTRQSLHTDHESKTLRRGCHLKSTNLNSRSAGRDVRPYNLFHIVRAVERGGSRRHISMSLHSSCGDNEVEITLKAVSSRIGPNQSRLQQLSSHRYRYSVLLTLPCI